MSIRRLAAGVTRRLAALTRNAFRRTMGYTVLIHTPKCGGTFIRQNLPRNSWSIEDVGHVSLRELALPAKARVVGCIREPLDWYLSYYFFLQQSLRRAPQGRNNFPPTHPMSAFSANGKIPFSQTMENMASERFLRRTIEESGPACVYGRDYHDLFDFLLRTKSGFWTWTMLHHFSPEPMETWDTPHSIIGAAQSIAKRVAFIRQEMIERDMERLLGTHAQSSEIVNASARSAKIDLGTAPELVWQRDGAVAHVLGYRSAQAPSASPTAASSRDCS